MATISDNGMQFGFQPTWFLKNNEPKHPISHTKVLLCSTQWTTDRLTITPIFQEDISVSINLEFLTNHVGYINIFHKYDHIQEKKLFKYVIYRMEPKQ